MTIASHRSARRGGGREKSLALALARDTLSVSRAPRCERRTRLDSQAASRALAMSRPSKGRACQRARNRSWSVCILLHPWSEPHGALNQAVLNRVRGSRVRQPTSARKLLRCMPCRWICESASLRLRQVRHSAARKCKWSELSSAQLHSSTSTSIRQRPALTKQVRRCMYALFGQSQLPSCYTARLRRSAQLSESGCRHQGHAETWGTDVGRRGITQSIQYCHVGDSGRRASTAHGHACRWSWSWS